MRHRRNRFRKAPKSPFNEDGPNSQSLRHGLEWLQTHDRDSHPHHISVEIPKEPEKLRNESPEESVKPATPDQSHPTPENDPSQPETQIETQIEAKPDSAADADATQTQQTSQKETDPETLESKPAPAQPQPAQTQPDRTQPPPQPKVQPDKTSEIILELEEAQAEEAEIRNASRGPRHRGLDPRRFPKHVNTIGGPIDLRKHVQLCCICQHPERDAIEEAFLQWRRPGEIRREFKLTNRSCIYRHAHAFGLFSKRARHLRFGLENIIEESSFCRVSADSVIRAIRAHSCLDENGRWIEPPRKLIIVREVIPAPAPLPPPPPKNLIGSLFGLGPSPSPRHSLLHFSLRFFLATSHSLAAPFCGGPLTTDKKCPRNSVSEKIPQLLRRQQKSHSSPKLLPPPSICRDEVTVKERRKEGERKAKGRRSLKSQLDDGLRHG